MNAVLCSNEPEVVWNWAPKNKTHPWYKFTGMAPIQTFSGGQTIPCLPCVSHPILYWLARRPFKNKKGNGKGSPTGHWSLGSIGRGEGSFANPRTPTVFETTAQGSLICYPLLQIPSFAIGLPSDRLTWRCTDPCRKTTFLLERGFLCTSMLISWWTGNLNHRAVYGYQFPQPAAGADGTPCLPGT